MRSSAGLLVLLAAFAGCAHGLRLAPEEGGKIGEATGNGLLLQADPASWDGEPADLERYLVPIEVQLVNDTDREVRVSYADFVLVDGNGFRYRALDPWGGRKRPRQAPPAAEPDDAPDGPEGEPEVEPGPEGDREDQGALWHEDSQAGAEAPALQGRILLAQNRGPAPRTRGSAAPPPRSSRSGPPAYVPHRSHSHGSWYWGPSYYGYWPWSYGWGPWYGPEYRVWIQGDGSGGGASGDILRFALPEGVLEPGGRVSGFVYFRASGSRSDRLSLSWNAHTSDGRFAATLSVPFKARR